MEGTRKYFLAAGLSGLLLATVIIVTQTVDSVSPESFGLREGDTISAVNSGDPDVYIVNEMGYKRLFLNPVIFGFYGHLGGFGAVKNVSPATRDAFGTSGLFRNCEANDEKVYALEMTGEDSGILHWLNITGEQAIQEDPIFFNKVFCVNSREFNWYNKGVDYYSLNNVPNYSFSISKQAENLGVDLKVNGSDSTAPVVWNSELLIAWSSTNVSRCSGFEYLPLVDKNIDKNNLPVSGEVRAYARNSVFAPIESIAIHLSCYDDGGAITEDFIEVPVESTSQPSIDVRTPRESESIKLGQNYEITWTTKNMPPDATVNIILYQNLPQSISIYRGTYWYLAKRVGNSQSFTWDTNKTLEPDVGRGTTSTKLAPGNYGVFILNSEETIYGASKNSLIVTP